MTPARLLDDATGIAGRRPAALLVCGALSWLPATGAALALVALVRSAEEPPRLELLGLGALSVAAWLCASWGAAAGLRICAGELSGAPVGLVQALRAGATDAPAALVAGALRAVLSALGLLPLGLGLPYARVRTAGLLPASVLDGASLRDGLALSRRAAGAFALAQGLAWVGWPLVWSNLLLAGLALAGALDPTGLIAPLQGQHDLALIAATGMLSLVLVEPLRLGGLAAAWASDRDARRGGDLLRRAEAA